MKKRVLSILLCGLMTVSVLSVSALALEVSGLDVLEATEEAVAEAEETVSAEAAAEAENLHSGGDDSGMAVVYDYWELVDALADPTVRELMIITEKMITIDERVPFAWPAEEVTLELNPVNPSCQLMLMEGTWVIPENVTVNAYKGLSGGIKVNGTWNIMNNYATMGTSSGSMTVNGTLAVAKDVRASLYGTVYLNGTFENAGTSFLYGSLVLGAGAEVVDIPDPELRNSVRSLNMRNGANVTAPASGAVSVGGRIVFEGTNSLSGCLSTDSIELKSGAVLTIPEGSDVTTAELRSNYSDGATVHLNVDGRLYLNGDGYNYVNLTEIALGENGVLRLAPYIQFGSSDSEASVTGTGTLELEGEMSERSDGVLYCSMAPQVFSQNTLRMDGEVYPPLPKVADSVKVLRLWDPDGVVGEPGGDDSGSGDGDDSGDGDGGDDSNPGDEPDEALKAAYAEYIHKWVTEQEEATGVPIDEGLYAEIQMCLANGYYEDAEYLFMICWESGFTDSVPMTMDEFAEQYASDGDDSGNLDLDGDGFAGGSDLVCLMKHLVGADTEIDTKAADMNGDGNIDILDVIRLVQRLAA